MGSKTDEDFTKLQKLLREKVKDSGYATVPTEELSNNSSNLGPPPAYHTINSGTNQDVEPSYSFKPEDQANSSALQPEPIPGSSGVSGPSFKKRRKKRGEAQSDDEDDALSCCLVSLFCLNGVVFVALSIAKVVMGSTYLHDCDIQIMIPIYLIVSGLAPIYFLKLICNNDDEICSPWQICWSTLGFLFCLAWLVCGSVWVYPTYGIVMADDFKSCTSLITEGCTSGDCDEVLIKFAFAMVSIDWIFLAVTFGLFILGICFGVFCD